MDAYLKEIQKDIINSQRKNNNAPVQIVFSKLGFKKFEACYFSFYKRSWNFRSPKEESYYCGCKVLRTITECDLGFDYLITRNR